MKGKVVREFSAGACEMKKFLECKVTPPTPGPHKVDVRAHLPQVDALAGQRQDQGADGAAARRHGAQDALDVFRVADDETRERRHADQRQGPAARGRR